MEHKIDNKYYCDTVCNQCNEDILTCDDTKECPSCNASINVHYAIYVPRLKDDEFLTCSWCGKILGECDCLPVNEDEIAEATPKSYIDCCQNCYDNKKRCRCLNFIKITHEEFVQLRQEQDQLIAGFTKGRLIIWNDPVDRRKD